MSLPPSGPLSINQIRNELGSSSGSLRTLSSLAGFSTPDKISDFYGYGPTPVNTIVYAPSSGLYPLSGSSTVSTSGVITNYFNVIMRIYCVFNSAGLSSGTVYNDYMTIVPLATKDINGVSFSGTGQLIFSSYYSLAPNSSYNITLSKGDLLGGGSTVRFYRSNDFGGDILPI